MTRDDKQKLEDFTVNPIICIGSYHIDKKIRELMKVCYVIELKKPTNEQIRKIIQTKNLDIDELYYDKLIKNIDGDLKKLNTFLYMVNKDKNNFLNINFRSPRCSNRNQLSRSL